MIFGLPLILWNLVPSRSCASSFTCCSGPNIASCFDDLTACLSHLMCIATDTYSVIGQGILSNLGCSQASNIDLIKN